MPQAGQRLLEVWRRRIHPAASRQQVSVAFALLAGGAVLAVLGVAVVWLGDAVLTRPSWLREVGFVAAALGLPVFLGGLIAGLPTRSWIAALGLLGLAASLAGVTIFSVLYPDRWFLQIQAPNTYAIASYLGGVSAQAAAASASLASSFVERHTSDAGDGDGPPGVSDEEVERDLRWAARQDWSWGGVPREGSSIQIQLEPEAEEVALLQRGGMQVRREEQSATATREAARALSGLRGQRGTQTDRGVAGQTEQLRKLKRSTEEQASRSLLWKLKHPWRWLTDR